MNTELAISEVITFRNLLDSAKTEWDLAAVRVAGEPPFRDEVLKRLPVIEAIAQAVDERLAVQLRKMSGVPGAWPYVFCQLAATELLGVLENRERVEEIIGVAGPVLAAARMHPWVWDIAAERWGDGRHRDAIQAAATAIFDLHLPLKLVETGWEPERMVAAFRPENSPGEKRLRLDGFPDPDDWRNAHRGAQDLGLACVKLVRNIRTHNIAEPEESVALEELAMLSRFARLVKDANVVVC